MHVLHVSSCWLQASSKLRTPSFNLLPNLQASSLRSMSACVTEEVMRLLPRFCTRRSLWQQRSFRVTASIKDTSVPGPHLTQTGTTKLNQTYFSRSLVGAVRFYSQDKIFSNPGSKLPAEIHHEDSPRQRHRGSNFNDMLERCGSPSDVLDLTCRYAPTARQTSNCLTHMWATVKKLSEEQKRYELRLMFEHPGYDKLMQTAMGSAGHMRGEDLVYSLISMVNLGVPQHSRVVQTFLRTCQENLNDFDEKVLSILASCLGLMKESRNVTALKEAMRLVVLARLPSIKNIVTLQTMMRLLGEDVPLNLKRKLEAKALSMADEFSLINSVYMISTLATMGFYSKQLLHICSKKIKEDLHLIPFSRLMSVLQAFKQLQYKDLDLLNSISDHIASSVDIWTHKQLVLFMSVFESLAVCPTAFMATFAEKVIANPDALTRRDLLCVLKVYSSFNYDLQDQRQQFLDCLCQVLETYLPQMSGFELLKSVYCLCLLGHVPSAPLEQLLQSSTLERFKTTEPKFLTYQERMFRTVDLCLRLDRPPLLQPLTVPESFHGDPVHGSPSVHPWLSQSLRSVLEDPDTKLQEMVVVEKFYVIDAVITKPLSTHGSGGAGVPSSPAESSQRIALVCTPHSGFCFGTSNPRGPLAVKIRHLKILGYEPVLVVQKELESMSEEKRTEFLRGLIFPEQHLLDTQPETEQLGS